MTDQELTELAAKALGKTNGEWFSTSDGPVLVFGSKPFDPLNNSAEALSLSANLWINTDQFQKVVCAGRGGMMMPYSEADVINGDREAATRRAIVFVAAKIGQRIEQEMKNTGAAPI